MIFASYFLLFLVCQISISNEELSIQWFNEYVSLISNIFFIIESIIRDTRVELETIGQLDSSIDEKYIDIEMEIIEINASPAMECIISELFRIYEPFCYRRSYGRGAGYPLNACPANAPDKSGLLCYPECRDGYIGVGPVCWQDCGKMKTVGIFCIDSNAVESSYDDDDKSNIAKAPCSSCPNNVTDSKSSYQHIFIRKSYGRGFGSPMVCSSQYEQNGALCYNYCDKRYFGVGPVCWQYCPSSQPTSCTVGCSITSSDCTIIIIEMFTALISASMDILRLKVVRSLIEAITNNLIISATKNDWISVAKNMSILSNAFAEAIVSDVSKNCDAWPVDTLESATKNASLLFTVTAFNDTNILRPFLKLFDIISIIKAFDHALCNLHDDFLH
jgi:hypothetical protein